MNAPQPTTMLDLVWRLSAGNADDRAVVEAVTVLVNTGRFVLCGCFAGERLRVN